ncbi:MAG: hypothetical protein ISP94_00400 [SAR86 cluster bacterium]|nr:hypothetical protein [SAR86 cluster bacterium]
MSAKNYNIFILGTVRNVEKTIINDVKAIKKFTEKFKTRQFCLLESDSKDNTLKLLGHLRDQDSNFNFITLGKLQEKYPLRTERLAFCRNKLLSWLKQNKLSNNTLVIVADFDGVNTKIDDEGFIDALSNMNNWDAIFANQKIYYDIWALRAEGWSENDCWEEFETLKQTMNEKDALVKAITSKQVSLDVEMKYLPVTSAFGGLGIYKAEHYIKGQYRGVVNNREICEHVTFNESLSSSGSRMFIKTDMLNNPPKQHIQTPFKKIKNFLQKIWH